MRDALQGLRSKLPPGSMEVLVVTGQAAVGFVIMASAMLLLLFFFLNHIFAVVLVRLLLHRLLCPACLPAIQARLGQLIRLATCND